MVVKIELMLGHAINLSILRSLQWIVPRCFWNTRGRDYKACWDCV